MSKTAEDYKSISKLRRLAIFLTVIGPECAAEILKSFNDSEVEALSREMVSIDLIDETTQSMVMEEFSALLIEGITSVRGGYDATLNALQKARGANHARTLVGKMEPMRDSREVIERVSKMDSRQVANLIKNEQPQTIAYLLGAMETQKAAEILKELDEEIRPEVIILMGTLDPTPSVVLDKVVRNLFQDMDSRTHEPMSYFGGAGRVAQLLNHLDKTMSNTLLSEIEEGDAALGASVRQKMFSFNDLVQLSQQDMQTIMREIDTSTLVLAMKPASPKLKEMIFGCLSKRAAEALKEEMELLGAVRLKDAQAAQDGIIQMVRQMEEDGEITLEGEDGNEYV